MTIESIRCSEPIEAKQLVSSPIRCGATLGLIGGVARFVLAVPFLLSSAAHLDNPYAFVANIMEYHVVGFRVAVAMAFCLPWLHLVIGLCLAIRFFDVTALHLAAGLLLVYTTAQLVAFMTGRSIDCGCFGVHSSEISLSSVVKVASLAFIALWLVSYHRWRRRAAEEEEHAQNALPA